MPMSEFWKSVHICQSYYQTSKGLFFYWCTMYSYLLSYLPRDVMHKRGLCHHAVSVCLSVCLSRSSILSKRINTSSKISPSGSHTILVFLQQTLWQYFDEVPSNGGVKCRWGRQKSRFSANIWLHRVLWTIRRPSAIYSAATNRGKLLTLVARKRRRLFFTADDDEVFMTRSLNVTPKTTDQHLIVRSGKSEAEVRTSAYVKRGGVVKTTCNTLAPFSRATFSSLIVCLCLAYCTLLSASLYVSKRGAYWDRLCRDVVGRWLVCRWLVGRWLSRACTVAKRCILGL